MSESKELVLSFSQVVLCRTGVDQIILHIGTNDTTKQQSELLKLDFVHLFNVVKQCHNNSNVYVSGPTPTLGCGIGHFSRLLSLNTWLSSACDTHNVHFIYNFYIFWQCDHLLRADGLHLNKAGARTFYANIAYSIYHSRALVSTCPTRQSNILTPRSSRAFRSIRD